MTLREEIVTTLAPFAKAITGVKSGCPGFSDIVSDIEALVLREKRSAVEEYIGRLIHLEPEIGNKESSDDARLYCRLVTAQMDMFERPMSLTESNLTTFPS